MIQPVVPGKVLNAVPAPWMAGALERGGGKGGFREERKNYEYLNK